MARRHSASTGSFAAALAAFALATAAQAADTASESSTAAALRSRYAAMRERLEHSAFQQHLYLESAESPHSLQGDIWAVVDYPLAAVSGDLDRSPDNTEMLVGLGDLAARRESVRALGLATIGRFLDKVEPLLVEYLALRLPAGLWFGERHRAVAELSDYNCEHIVKLVRRRQQPWLAIIG